MTISTHKWVRLSIRGKIFLSFLLSFIVLLSGTVIILQTTYRNFSRQQYEEQNSYESSLIVGQLEKTTKDAEHCANSVILSLNSMLSPTLWNRLRSDDTVYTEGRVNLAAIDNNLLLFPMVSNITVVYSSGKFYAKERNQCFVSNMGPNDLYQSLQELRVPSSGLWRHPINEEPGSKVLYVKELRNDISMQQEGFVILTLSLQVLADTLQGKEQNTLSNYFLYDENGVFLSTNRVEVPQALQTYAQDMPSLEKKDYIVTTNLVGRQQWKLFSALDLQPVKENIREITVRVLLVGVCVLLLFSLLSFLISHRIANPIRRLAEYMGSQNSTLLGEIEEPPQHDEVGALIKSFNHMVRRNKELFDYVQWERRTKQKLELALLQTQIKPHFLYNTLDTIYCLILMEKSEDAGRVTKLLADYYRSTLNKGEEWIWLADEIKAVAQYLEIQKVRYRDFVEYTVDIPSSMNQIQIPKMTLQPLVENALYHGVKARKNNGKLIISGEMKDGWVYLHVADNGEGMSEEAFRHALEQDETSHTPGSFGLRNVESRLKLFFGEKSHLRMKREEDQTIVSICLYWGKE